VVLGRKFWDAMLDHGNDLGPSGFGLECYPP